MMEKRSRNVLPRSMWVAVFLFVQTVAAQMPHRVAVLVNETSQASKQAANLFMALHGVPDINRIGLDLPETMASGRFECTPEEFRTLIYEPAKKLITERGLDEQIAAWVYSVDFPIRVVTSENDRRQMSLMGLTFTRGTVPDPEQVEQGKVTSPLFAGPVQADGSSNPPRSFDVFAASLKEKMPLPSMMLGYIGENGSSMENVLRSIQNGARARQSGVKHPVLLVKTADEMRSAPRDWQFAAVEKELEQRDGSATVYTNQPPAQTNLLGVMTGAATVDPSTFGSFAPGAFGEHLTSWSAEFQKPQTKCTAWIDAGATVTAGMVTEPYNNWVKFPHARFFVYYASGCSAMESFYQAILSPMQVLLLGNPLSQITGLPVQIETVGLRDEIRDSINAAFVAKAKFPVDARALYSAVLNGKQIKEADGTTLIELPFDEMGDGYHEVRLIAQALSPVSPGGFKTFPVQINKKGRSLAISGMTGGGDQAVGVTVEPGGDELPSELYLLWNGLELDRKPYAADAALLFEERRIGEGPHRIQAVAVYEDGMEVRSPPQTFAIAFKASAE
jgi:uncharacterized protein (TIGR03790 family)